MRVLLTGANGFIGGWIASIAAGRDHEVIGVGRTPTPGHPVAKYIRHDLATPLIFDEDVDVVVHCAALTAAWAPPRAYQAANIDATRNVIDWCAAHGSPHLIYISSSSVFYQDSDQFDLTESSPIPPPDRQLSAYSRTKRAGELLTEGYQGAWTVLRPRAVFGPGDTVLLPRIVDAARRGRLPLLERADGRPAVCDVTYVENIAHYAVTAAEQRVTGSFNLTNGEPVEMYQFLLSALDRLGCPRPTRRLPVWAAMGVARALEIGSAIFAGYREPPITRFGVSVLAYSKTFDVSRCRTALGPPPVSLAEGVDRMVAAETERH